MESRDGQRVGVISITADGRYTTPSPEFLELFGVAASRVEGSPVGIFSPGLEALALEAFEAFVASGEPVSLTESVLTRPDGTTVEVRCTMTIDLEDARRYRATFEELEPGTVRAARMRNPSVILHEWREAERVLAGIGPHDPRRFDAAYRVSALRAEYQRLFRDLAFGTARTGAERRGAGSVESRAGVGRG